MKRFASILLIAASAMLGACTQIDTGNVGVESTLGQVKPDPLPPGVYFTLFKHVDEVCSKEMRVSIEDMKPQTSDKITLSDMDIDLFVSINPAKAPAILTKWAGDRTEEKDENCVRIGMGYVTRQARDTIYDVATKYGSATIHTERAAIATAVVKQLQTSLDNEIGKGMFTVASANVRNLVTDPALEQSIKAAANSQFKLQEEKNKLQVAEVEADRKRTEARGEADAIRIKAEAVSKQGGAEYVQLQAIAKWDGKLPATNAGGAVPFINVK